MRILASLRALREFNIRLTSTAIGKLFPGDSCARHVSRDRSRVSAFTVQMDADMPMISNPVLYYL